MKHQSFKLCLLIAVMTAVLVVFGSITVFASDVSGTCGDNLKWTFDVNTETLTISGTGDMQDYDNPNITPWDQYRSRIKQVVINKGVTSLGSRAFRGFKQLTSVSIPSSVTSIGPSAFSGCSQLTSISIPNSVTSIGNHTFYDCSALTEIYSFRLYFRCSVI